MIPKNNKSYALERIPTGKWDYKKKIHAPNIFHPPPPLPVISNRPSLINVHHAINLFVNWEQKLIP